ncbi:hypothetical protein GH714_026272 [Hevea brasiliensis]|uniref:GYF domain-containing protein n=1 Tax=Hevea brasiliensis TaxID=3981 RepID=A0A6A6N6Q6_HEVBR|nr:hypothetical protein GH714_026272 [Hevea brasiliensis]
MDRLLLLRTPTEQSRLLHDIPEIIADEAEVETAENDLSSKDEKGNNTSPESACGGMSKPWRKSSSGNRIPSYLNDGANFAEQKQQSEEPKSEEMVKQHHTNHARGGDDIHQTESCESPLEVKQNCSKASHPELISGQLLASIPQGQPIASGSGQKQQSEEPESEEMARQHHTSHASGGDGIHQTESCESALEVKQNHSKASHSKLISGQLLASIPQGQPIASGSGQKQQSEEPESKEMARQHHTSHARGGDGIHQTENCESALEVKQSHSKASHPELVSGQLLASIPQGQPIASGSGLKQQSEEPESEQMVKQHHTSHASGGQLLASIPQGQPIASGSGLKQQSEEPESEEMVKQHHTSHASGSDDIRQTESCESALEVKENYSKASHPELISGQLLASIPQGQPIASGSGQQYQPSTSGEKQEKPVDVEHEKVKNMQSEPQMELIELRNDEEQDTNIAKSKQTPDDLDSSIWYVVSPHGIKRGPYSMSVLKQWSDTSYSELKFKVWKTDQSPEEAVFLTDAICQVFSAKKRKF